MRIILSSKYWLQSRTRHTSRAAHTYIPCYLYTPETWNGRLRVSGPRPLVSVGTWSSYGSARSSSMTAGATYQRKEQGELACQQTHF